MKKEYIKPEAEQLVFQLEEELMSTIPSTNLGVGPLPQGVDSTFMIP